jgi:hypothetical protein
MIIHRQCILLGSWITKCGRRTSHRLSLVIPSTRSKRTKSPEAHSQRATASGTAPVHRFILFAALTSASYRQILYIRIRTHFLWAYSRQWAFAGVSAWMNNRNWHGDAESLSTIPFLQHFICFDTHNISHTLFPST